MSQRDEDVSNLESNTTPTNQREEADAGDVESQTNDNFLAYISKPTRQTDVSNLESETTFKNQRQEADAGDSSAKALWPLFVKIEPALSSLLRDLTDWNADERKSQEKSPDFLAYISEPTRQTDVSNLESETTFKNQRQEADAGDSTAKALWPLFVEIQPALSSLLRDLTDWNADERKSQEKSVQKKEEEAIKSTEDVNSTETNETIEREERFKYLSIYLPLLQAGLRGDWEATKAILETYPDAVRKPITEGNENILHIAALTNCHTFVKELLKWMSPEDLEMKDWNDMTALLVNAFSGSVKIAKEMVKKNNKLLLIRDRDEDIPLLRASWMKNRDMVYYLFSVTPFELLTASDRIMLLTQTISADMYDIALKILQNDPTLAIAKDSKGRIALEVLAERPFAVSSRGYKGVKNKAFMQTLAHELVEGLWKNIIILPSEQFIALVDEHPSFLFVAAELGNVEFLNIIFRSYPNITTKLDDKSYQTVFHTSIFYRQESVFNLIYEIGGFKNFVMHVIDGIGNNMLHFAAQLPPPKRLNIVSGAALQMQRELLWFKEIEKIMPPAYVNEKNLEGHTPQDIFTKTHRDLQRDGEKWMKDTSNYCMLVATLIATVVFTAAFTVPGGNKQENGTPFFLESNWFMVFFIADAIALLSSSSSILIFLSILTSRYNEEDFLKSLPERLVFGLTTLFISIVGMVVAFSATCFLVYKSKTTSIPIVIIASAGVPIILFVGLHYDLWFDIIRSTYWSRFLFGPRKHGLFKQM